MSTLTLWLELWLVCRSPWATFHALDGMGRKRAVSPRLVPEGGSRSLLEFGMGRPSTKRAAARSTAAGKPVKPCDQVSQGHSEEAAAQAVAAVAPPAEVGMGAEPSVSDSDLFLNPDDMSGLLQDILAGVSGRLGEKELQGAHEVMWRLTNMFKERGPRAQFALVRSTAG